MTRHLCILISPSGEEFYENYGPMTKRRDQASRYESPAAAMGSAMHRYGRHSDAFWNSERESQRMSEKTFRDWTARVEEVPNDDVRRKGHFIMDYAISNGDDRRYAHGDPSIGLTWLPDLQDCHLWSDREDAMKAIRTMPKHDGRRYAIDTY